MVVLALGVLLAVAPLYGASASEGPVAVIQQTALEFGKAVRGSAVERGLVVGNAGAGPLQILHVRMTPPLTMSRAPAWIAPGERASLRFRLDTSTLSGAFEGEILLTLNDPARPEVRLPVEARIVRPVEVSPMPAVFLTVQRGQRKEASVEIVNHEAEPLRIERVEHASDRVATRLEALEDGRRYRLSVSLKGEGPAGKRTEPVLVRTSSPTTPLLRIAANTYVRERVYTFPEAVDLGALPLSELRRRPELVQRLTQTLMVYQAGGSDFRVDVRADLPGLDVKWERGPRGDRYQITIALPENRLEPGPIRGTIQIETNDPEFRRLTVPISGRILDH